ncbi:ABC transporter ATP-binding protein [Lachnospira multipara]|uniref:ABC transporter ATP-binding protein n=1 Tax=Lachnospira multipara TaxID=28051 RepID=UPI000686995C|nr:ABC transporter ATP-binding protein [Lachnospira multipara]
MNKIISKLSQIKNKKEYFHWLFIYSKPYIPKILLVMFFNIMATVISILMALLSKKIIDSAQGGNIILWAIGIYLLMIFVNVAFTIANGVVSIMLNERFSFGIRKQVYEKIINAHWMDIKKYHTGDLMTRFTSDAGNVADGIVNTIPTIIELLFELIATFATLFYYEPLLAIFAIILAPIAALISYAFAHKMHKYQKKVQESESAYRSFVQESLANLLIVKAFTIEDHSVDKLTNLRDERFKWVLKRAGVGMASSSVLNMAFQFGYIAAFAFGAIQLSNNSITYGTMSVFLTLVNRIQAPIISLASQLPKIVSIFTSAGRIIELEEIQTEEKQMTNIESNTVGVKLQDVSFGYNPKDIVLDNVNLDIKPGEFVGIVGESGIGKTTLVRLIMSFMNQNNGLITFYNEKDQHEAANASTREFISYVPQGNTLFSGTILENIKMGNMNATDEEIQTAINMAAADSFINDLPMGVNTVIGERGHGISEGQAQRVAIARALIRKAPFLVLDEATSALDENTEIKVLEGIKKLNPRPTCLLITHRRSVLDYCDREIKIDNGHIY